MKFILILCIFLLNGCATIICTLSECSQADRECGFSERCYHDKIRERFIRLSPEERQKEREWCSTHKGCWMSLHQEPTPKELEKLKNEKK